MRWIVFAFLLFSALIVTTEALPQIWKGDKDIFRFPTGPFNPVPCVCVTHPCPCDGSSWPRFDKFNLRN